MRRVVGVGGHLDSYLSARSDGLEQPWEERFVSVHPLQRGVGEEDIDRSGRREIGDIAELEP